MSEETRQVGQRDHDTGELRFTQSTYTADELTGEQASDLQAAFAAVDAEYGVALENARNAEAAALQDLYAAAQTHSEALSEVRRLRDEYARKYHAAKSAVGGGG